MEETEKKTYELSFLLKSEEDKQEIVDLLKKNGAAASFESSLGRIDLAYKVKKENSAFFGYVYFELEPDRLESFKKELDHAAGIIRFLIITPPVLKARSKTPQRHPFVKEEPSEQPSRSSTLPLSNKELEKEIKEILQ